MLRRASGTAFALAAVALLAPAAWADSTWTTAELEETATWHSPSGAPELIEWTLDGRLLLVLGADDDRTIHVLDRSLAPLGTARAPFEVRGASWSMKGRWLLAWGPDGDRDNITAWDVPSLAPNATVVPSRLLTVATIDAARFYAYDDILVVCGRDRGGRSRINVIEIRTGAMHVDLEHPANRTVLQLEDDGRNVVCLEEGGVIVEFSSNNWSAWGEPRLMTGEVTANGIGEEGSWLAGDENGVVRVFSVPDGEIRMSFELDHAPVLAVAYGSFWMNHIVVALPGAGDGGRIQVWRELNFSDEPEAPPFLVSELNTSSPLTAIARIPRAGANVTVGYADGRLVTYWLSTSQTHEPHEHGPIDDGGDDATDDDGWGGWYRTYGGLVALVAVALVLAVAYAWLRKREG